MGNFSRNTFDPTKNYVAVRLEQGVPLVDADWNELEDVTRTEVYEALRSASANVASRGGLDVAPAAANDIVVSAGRAVVDGDPIRTFAALQYSTQRYANAATAAADGVAQAAPLTQPAAARIDCVYLDVFEREVTSAEDPNLINGAIALETSTRLKREVVLRVAEGATSPPPAPPAGHAFLAIAIMSRTPGPITAAQIQDVKPYALPLGARELGYAPLLAPVTYLGVAQPAFQLETSLFPYRLVARKPSGQATAMGALHLPVPDGARLLQIHVRGTSAGTLSWQFCRSRYDGTLNTAVAADLSNIAGAYDKVVSIPATEPAVDNTLNYYHLTVYTTPAANVTDIYGVSIRVVP